MGKSTISMAIFNCYVSSPEGITGFWPGTSDVWLLSGSLRVHYDIHGINIVGNTYGIIISHT